MLQCVSRYANLMKALILSAWLVLVLVAPAVGQERLIAAYYPPMMISADGERKGFSVDIVEEAARRLGRQTTLSFLPFKRAMKTVERSNDAIQVSLFRNPSREPLFRWLARTHSEEMVFLTTGAPVDTLEAGRALGTIGVERGSGLDSLLSGAGFTNLDRVDRPEINALKLEQGRIDAWALAKNTAVSTWSEMGFERRLTVGATLSAADVYVVAGRGFSEHLATEYARVIEEMQQDGTINALIQSYTN